MNDVARVVQPGADVPTDDAQKAMTVMYLVERGLPPWAGDHADVLALLRDEPVTKARGRLASDGDLRYVFDALTLLAALGGQAYLEGTGEELVAPRVVALLCDWPELRARHALDTACLRGLLVRKATEGVPTKGDG